jgi:aspartate aminotransferase-like enzyme
MRKEYLFTPGPTPVPSKVAAVQTEDIIFHRRKDYHEVYERVVNNLRQFVGTEQPIILITGSGTSAMEAAVANIVSPGDRVVVVRGGYFGDRWTEMCKAFGGMVRSIDVEWGRAVNPRLIEQRLEEEAGEKTRAVFCTFVDTSTGTVNDVETIGEIVKKYEALLVVDAVSGIGCMDFHMDDWGVDVALSATQKGFMSPPGISIIALSADAWRVCEHTKNHRYYFNLMRYRENYDKFEPPYTPAINTVRAFDVALQAMKEEGPKQIFARHERIARATRAAISALGLTVFSINPANVLTVFKPPDEIAAQELRDHIYKKYGVFFAGGQGQLKGKVMRIGHMGAVTAIDILGGLGALEMGLADLGYDGRQGQGITAALEVLRSE